MNQVVLDLTPQPVTGTGDGSATGAKSGSAAAGTDLFRTVLATSIAAPPGVPALAVPSPGTAPDQALQTLEAKITKMLNAGASQTDVISALAKQLATTVASTLQTPGADARGKLQTLFANALAPPGTASGDAGTVVQQVADLARKFTGLTTAAEGIVRQQLGQQKLIAGNLLDAQRAKEIPARATTTANTAVPTIAADTGGKTTIANTGKTTIANTGKTTSALQASGIKQPGKPGRTGIADSSAANASDLSGNLPIGGALGATSLPDFGLPSTNAPQLVPTAASADVNSATAGLAQSARISDAVSIGTSGVDAAGGTTKLASLKAALSFATAPTAAAGEMNAANASIAPGSATAPAPTSAGNSADSSSAVDSPRLVSAVATLPLPAFPSGGSRAATELTSIKRSAKTAASDTSASRSESVAPGATSELGAPPADQSNATLPPAASAGRTDSGLPDQSANLGTSAQPVPSAVALSVARDATGGDGRTVDLGPLATTQSGGDTGLGRTLARAAVAADAREAALPADVSAAAPPTDAPAATTGVSDTAVSVFVKAFEVSLKANVSADVTRPAQHDATSPSALSLPAHDAADSVTAFVPAVAPFTIDRAAVTAAVAPPPAPVPVDHSAIADQVLRGAFMRNVGQSSEMRLTLAPDSLGDVNVKLVVNAGTVTAHVVAETSEVRDALVAAQPQLSKSLADSGLKLTSFTVDLQGGGFAGFAQQQQQSQNGNRARHSTNFTDGDGGDDDTLLEAIPSFGPSGGIKLNAGNYNYLA
jgi:flagellar hook-length control protein FliK